MTAEIQIHGETVAMELQKPTLLPSKMKMTLEQFIDFCDSDKPPHLFVNHLTLIIRMHSFKLIQSVPKDELVEAARSINLMEPGRTTLNNDDVSSGAFITIQEVIKDLSDLKWQECCITSLQTLNYNQQPLTTTAIATSAATVTSISSNKSKSKRDSSSSSNSKKKSSPAAVTKRRGKKLLGPADVDGPACCGKVSESVTCKKRKKIKS